jgi:DNA-binding NarL/FixJ family response regulator
MAISIFQTVVANRRLVSGADNHTIMETVAREKPVEAKKLRVLIVDDHLGWRKALGLYLSTLPELEVVGAVPDGYTALNVCQSLQPDLVLMDINMPGMDGFETARQLRARYPDLWIVGVSAEVSANAQERAQESGLRVVIPKDMLLDFLTPTIFPSLPM